MKRWKIIKRWIKMLFGKSQFHKPQSTGKYYSLSKLHGYYSDLRHKKNPEVILDVNGIPINITSDNKRIYFPITIFQYGLALYDLYLEKEDINILNNFYSIAKWAVDNADEQGRWNAFEWSKSMSKYSSMAQGEGASLLIRAYKESGEDIYLQTASNALNFMIKDVKVGGTSKFNDDGTVVFEETSDSLSILNGHIFSIWGLYDYLLIKENKIFREILDKSIYYIIHNINLYDNGYWSMYDLSGNIASPFYHDLHINQLIVIEQMYPNTVIKNMVEKWIKYQRSIYKKNRAFFKKAMQKLKGIKEEITLIK